MLVFGYGRVEPLFENGVIRLPRADYAGWVPQLEEELLRFPHGTEDMLDALWLAWRGIREQQVEPRIVFAEDIA